MKDYPVQIDIKVYITDGESTGSATFGLPVCKVPDEDTIKGALDAVLKSVPEGFRLMTKHETYNHWLREEKGYRGPQMGFSATGGEWHDPEAEGCHSSLFPDEADFDEEHGE